MPHALILYPPAVYSELLSHLQRTRSTLSPTSHCRRPKPSRKPPRPIQHVDHQSTTVVERRLPKNRRAFDLMDDVH